MGEVVGTVQIQLEMEEQLLRTMEPHTVVAEEEEDKPLQVAVAVRVRVQEGRTLQEEMQQQIRDLAVVEVLQEVREGQE
jgi:hypothetical protein